MANIKSKITRIKTNEKSRIRNNAIKSRVRGAIKKVRVAVLANSENVSELLAKAHKEINTAVSKGVLHKNNGSRKASRIDAFVAKHSVAA
ncbi:30S ribosomal protein S20 [Mesomycoplasma lagogenitalium]|uniref:Small ribosomal subunit protein bS20 n=1 Tax=Mesomycoplasma lagogenitalium TaxID=171286 RepID=A0ABY8LU85_9BACT|nr:30S ribosomal protein S20 [Mesomycoplasma lagogenitalium]WGI36800.1 30S ribosomal protein S20 [Mesomycoplasma lagogenitalium]